MISRLITGGVAIAIWALTPSAGVLAADGILGAARIKEALTNHTDATAVFLYTTPPNSKALDLAASTAAPAGQAPGKDVQEVVLTGQQIERPIANGFEDILPLLNVNGETIGALAVTFPKAVDDPARRRAAAIGIQQQVGRRISDSENVFEKYPFEPNVSDNNFAQALLLKTIERHPDAVVLAIHVVPPGAQSGLIIACNIGRVGMASDEADLEVIKTGKPELKVRPASRRFKVQVPLQDAAGSPVGALSVFFRYAGTGEPAEFQARAEAIRDELRSQIANKAILFTPVAGSH